MKTLTTLPEVIAHLEEVKAKMNAFSAENPDISFAIYQITDLQPALLYQIKEHIGENSYKDEVEYSNGKLSLWNGIKAFGFPVMFYSVPVALKSPVLEDVSVLQDVA